MPASTEAAPSARLQPVVTHSRDAKGGVTATLVMIGSDVLAIVTAFIGAHWIRFDTGLFDALPAAGTRGIFHGYETGGIVITALFVLILGNREMYGARRNTTLTAELVNVAKAISVGMVLVLAAAFFYRGFPYSRLVFSLFWLLAILTVFVGRATTIALARRHYRAGRRMQRAVIIGNGDVASNVFRDLDGHKSFGIRIVGYFADRDAEAESNLAASTRLGPMGTAARYVREKGVDLVLVAVDSNENRHVAEMIERCEGTNISFLMVPDFLGSLINRVKVAELGRIPFIALKGEPLSVWNRLTKRGFDIIGSSLLLLLAAPIMAILAALVRLTSPGPILFAQRRIGLVGSEFTMYKFRSMTNGSEKKDKEAGLGIKNDPRCTPLGKFMRRTSLDELPQLFNVLRGDMSLVGPRPERTHCVDEFRYEVPKYLDRHRVKTGLTGWAQVNGLRGDTSLSERIKYDLYYIENWSLAFDIRILLQTIRSVFQS